MAAEVDLELVRSLYRRGLVYFDVPVYSDDRFSSAFVSLQWIHPFGSLLRRLGPLMEPVNASLREAGVCCCFFRVNMSCTFFDRRKLFSSDGFR